MEIYGLIGWAVVVMAAAFLALLYSWSAKSLRSSLGAEYLKEHADLRTDLSILRIVPVIVAGVAAILCYIGVNAQSLEMSMNLLVLTVIIVGATFLAGAKNLLALIDVYRARTASEDTVEADQHS